MRANPTQKNNMTTYYYDKDSRTLLAVTEHGAVSILEPINLSTGEQVEASPVQKPKKTDTPKFTKGCPECGSTTRHKKDCSNAKGKPTKGSTGNDAWAALDKEEKKRANLMSVHKYNQVKTAHNHGMDPTSIAHEMSLGVKEVNTAILSKTFEAYSE
jgi:hypothetical protein